MLHTYIMRVFSLAVTVLTVAVIIYVFVAPPPSMQVTRDDVPLLMGPIEHPETGEALDVNMLVRHYRGD